MINSAVSAPSVSYKGTVASDCEMAPRAEMNHLEEVRDQRSKIKSEKN